MDTTDDTIEMIEDEVTGNTDDEDDDDDDCSSPESAYDDGNDLMSLGDDGRDVTAQLAAAGPIGVAAAAAIASAKKKKRPHSFETNPSIRKRQQNRLLRKLRVSYCDWKFKLNVYSNLILSVVLSFPANDLRVRDPRRPTGGGAGRHAGQAEHQLQGVWREAARGCRKEPEEHRDGRA